MTGARAVWVSGRRWNQDRHGRPLAERPGPTRSRATASPLRRAATWTIRPAGWQLLAWVVALAALVLFLAAVDVSHACNHPPPPITHPEPGTPRQSYCSTVQGVGVGWLCFAAPLLVLGVGIVALRRAAVPSVVLAVAISASAVVNATIVSDLRAIQIVPGINA
ncbi:hypothetical protein AB0L40_26020 [Patulibacter sp. NPDC049589]|uniref:hypothetical protein n=1 Tax=Patulibacter sp. NPDC049589 TaxID=3154731 RepID=UPI00342E2345